MDFEEKLRYAALPIHKQLQLIFEDMAENLGQRLAAGEIINIFIEERERANGKVDAPLEVKCKLIVYEHLKTRINEYTAVWDKKNPLWSIVEANLKKTTKYFQNGNLSKALYLLFVLYDALKKNKAYKNMKKKTV